MIFARGKRYYHGIILKLSAIACKGIFLFYIVPHLKDKVFSEYVYYLTVSIFISRFICWGANDQIPVVVKRSRVHELDFWVFLFLMLSIISFIISMSLKLAILSTMSIVIVMITETIMEGMLILTSMKSYEKLLNIPWIIFILITLFVPVYNTIDLLNFYNLAYIITHLLIFFIFLDVKFKTIFKTYFSFFELIKLIKGGYLKVINQLLFLVNLRGLIILPKILKGVIVSDTIALGITIAEAISTIFMVIINRNFSNYCKNKVKNKDFYLNSFKVSSLFLISGIIISASCYFLIFFNLNYFNFDIPLDKINPFIVFCSFCLFSVALGFIEIRNYHWAIKKNEIQLIFVLAAVFFIQALCVFYLRIDMLVFIFPVLSVIFFYFCLVIFFKKASAKV